MKTALLRGLAIAYTLALVPLMWLPVDVPLPDLGIDWLDKLQHVVAYAGLSVSWLLAGATMLTTGIAVGLWSVALECGQLLVPGREFSAGDLLANGAGVIAGLLCWRLRPGGAR